MRLAAAVLTALVVAIPSVASAQTASIDRLGWWTRRPAPITVPEGGFEVALAPDGPLSVAALRFDLTGDVSRAELQLVESGGVLQAGAALVACGVSGGWEAAVAGSFDDAPEPDCERASVAFDREPEAAIWTADITPLIVGSSPSVMILPATTGNGTFQVVVSTATLDADLAPPAPPPAAPPTPAPAPPSEPPVASVPPPAGAPAPPAAVPSEPVATPTPIPEVSTPAPVLAVASQGGDDGEARPWWRLVAFVPLSAAVGFAGIVARRLLGEGNP